MLLAVAVILFFNGFQFYCVFSTCVTGGFFTTRTRATEALLKFWVAGALAISDVRPTPTIVTVLLVTVATVGTELVIVTGCPDEAIELITIGGAPLV